jgi:hypothetical protein
VVRLYWDYCRCNPARTTAQGPFRCVTAFSFRRDWLFSALYAGTMGDRGKSQCDLSKTPYRYTKEMSMTHDSEYFRRRAAEARAAAYCKEDGDGAALAGDLALAFAALARRSVNASGEEPADDIPLAATEQA